MQTEMSNPIVNELLTVFSSSDICPKIWALGICKYLHVYIKNSIETVIHHEMIEWIGKKEMTEKDLVLYQNFLIYQFLYNYQSI